MLALGLEGSAPPPWVELFPDFAVSPGRARGAHVLLAARSVSGWFNRGQGDTAPPTWSSSLAGDTLLLEGPDLAASLHREGDRLRGELVASGEGGWIVAFALRSILHHALRGRGLLLHASGVVRRGQLLLFLGRSGAGKTTIARELAGGGRPFSLDRVALLREELGPVAHPTPFSDFQGRAGRHEPTRPRALLFLEQGPRHQLEPLSAGGVAARLVQHSLASGPELGDISAPLEVASWIAERIPGFRLTFRRDEGFWTILDSELGGQER